MNELSPGDSPAGVFVGGAAHTCCVEIPTNNVDDRIDPIKIIDNKIELKMLLLLRRFVGLLKILSPKLLGLLNFHLQTIAPMSSQIF